MATLRKRLRGKSLEFEIRFFADGVRRSIPLGAKFTERTATELHGIVETLLRFKDNGETVPDKRTLSWIETATPEIREKLANAGLIELPEPHTVKELWTAFRKTDTEPDRDIKESTGDSYDHAERRFFNFFGTAEDLSELTKERMEQWKKYLRKDCPNERTGGHGLAGTTTAGTIQKAKAIFNYAVRIGWIDESPLDGVGRGSFINRDNDRFVTMDEYRRLLDACPCQDWRVILALTRIGGLRCPSEVLRLRWDDVNWNQPERFYVTSSKTERHTGKGGRVVPLWEDLAVELRRLFESASSEGTEFVINRYRNPERTNLGTQFGRIVKMAGVQPIQRPFDNMRASRSTEVYSEYGAFLESQWIGHSTRVARDHYLQVREEDFERAVGGKPTGEKSIFPPLKTGFPPQPEKFPPHFPPVNTGNGLQVVEGVQTASIR